MTPAIALLKRSRVDYRLHEYAHAEGETRFGDEVVAALGVAPERVFKTLVVALDGDPRRLAVAILPVSAQLDLKAMAKAAGAKKVEMADPAVAEKATGYVVGGISPLAQRKRLPSWLDTAALAWETIYVSAGKRGLQVELAGVDLATVLGAATAPLSRTD